MSLQRKIYNFATPIVLLVSLLLFFPIGSCDQIEFEPVDMLYITTDSIQTLTGDNYLISGSVLNIGQEDIIQHGFCWTDSGTPTIDNSAIQLGSRDSIGSFSSILSDLRLRTTYYIRAYASTNTDTEYGNEQFFRTRPPVIDSIVKDIEGNSYKVVVIGSQAWMAENLRTSLYADGSVIPLVENDSLWQSMTVVDKAYCWYDNDQSNAHYGAYYTWAAAMNGERSSSKIPSQVQGVCPDGWHIPSDAEWNQMHITLGMNPYEADNIGFIGTRQNVGNKMKGIGIPLWEGLTWNGEYNESGFSALPVGLRSNSGNFDNVNKYTYFWSSTGYEESDAWYRYLQRGHSAVLRVHIAKDNGFSVRCVLD